MSIQANWLQLKCWKVPGWVLKVNNIIAWAAFVQTPLIVTVAVVLLLIMLVIVIVVIIIITLPMIMIETSKSVNEWRLVNLVVCQTINKLLRWMNNNIYVGIIWTKIIASKILSVVVIILIIVIVVLVVNVVKALLIVTVHQFFLFQTLV